MEIEEKSPISFKCALLFVFAMFWMFSTTSSSKATGSRKPLFTVVADGDRPLTVLSLPLQQAQANTNFSFNLAPFVNMLQPEVNYRVTTRLPSFCKIFVWPVGIPKGISRINTGEHVCAEVFTLAPNESCVLRFSVNKSAYVRSINRGPLVCVDMGNVYCNEPAADSRIDTTVARAPNPTQFLVIPASQDGLQYDPNTLSIVGKPTRLGAYYFTVSATNGVVTTSSQTLTINATVNLVDKPIFKRQYNITAATADQDYHMNLMSLIEMQPSFGVSNQVHFRIDDRYTHPKWIQLDTETSTILQGHVYAEDAGKVKVLTIIARSNTGGDSEPFTMTIPVAYDPTKKPSFRDGIELNGEAGAAFINDFRSSINDPAADSSLKIILDKVEPAAPWLSVEFATRLEGVVPERAIGQTYQLTMLANTETGGNSDPVVIPLHIGVDEKVTPRFISAHPQLPLMYAGQSYVYDFVSNEDVFPRYSDLPYVVELASGYENPDWLRIEDNKLIVDKVPNDINGEQSIYITMKNIPGGISSALVVKLFIMN